MTVNYADPERNNVTNLIKHLSHVSSSQEF